MRLIAILVVTFFAFLSALFLKYYLFGYIDWDLAFFSQASWKLLHGDQFVPLVGINYFGDHSYFIHFFILPVFYLFPSAWTLVVLKLIAFFVAAYLLYRLAEERLGGGLALGVALLYLFFPGNLFGLFYEFNPEAFAAPFLVLMFIALHRKNVRGMMFWAVFLMLIKENMFIVAAAFGVRAIFIAEKGDRRLCILFTIACLAVFFFLVLVVIPHFRGLEHHAFTVRYAWLGNSAGEMLLGPILHPKVFWEKLLCPLNQQYIQHLFGYLLLPALLSPAALCMMLPLLLQHLLSNSMAEHTIYYHYVLAMAPFIFLAFIETLSKLQGSQRFSRGAYWLMAAVMMMALPTIFSYQKPMLIQHCRILDQAAAEQVWGLIKGIPNDAPVVTTFRFLAPLSTRAEVYSFHMLYGDQYNDLDKMGRSELNTKKSFALSRRVSYALLDLEDPWYVATLHEAKPSELKRIDDFFNDPGWKVIKRVGQIVLLKRDVTEHN